MNVNLDQNTANKVAETAKNVSRIVANLTDKPAPKPAEKKQENMNQPHTQTVEVKVGGDAAGNASQKPTVIHEKKETHVHKTYPDQRALTEAECAVETLRIKNEHELRMREMDFRVMVEEYSRKDRKEREEYERKERERRRERERRFTRYACIGLGVAGAAAIGYAAYDFCTHSGLFKNRGLALQPGGAVAAEGSVT